MIDRDDLIALGFVDDSGVLRIRNVSVSLAPTDRSYYRLEIALPHGGELFCVVPAAALKVTAPEIDKIDIDALLNIDPSSRHRPW
jgi:hypothetical protein